MTELPISEQNRYERITKELNAIHSKLVKSTDYQVNFWKTQEEVNLIDNLIIGWVTLEWKGYSVKYFAQTEVSSFIRSWSVLLSTHPMIKLSNPYPLKAPLDWNRYWFGSLVGQGVDRQNNTDQTAKEILRFDVSFLSLFTCIGL